MSTLMQASRQWATRPSDQRFLTLTDMLENQRALRLASTAKVIENRALEVCPADSDGDFGLAVQGPNGTAVMPTNWAFGQLAQRAGAPAGYLRELPAPVAADCLNWSLRQRDTEELGVLLTRVPSLGGLTPEPMLTAVTGPTYGRIWNDTILAALVERFGNGQDGDTFRVPGEFGKAVAVTKENTTLYASDRDMFVFLADESHRIEMPNRRDGKSGSLARGFFAWNSIHGSTTFGLATFLFDYVCCNRIVWGAEEYAEIKIRHSSGAPRRWIDEVAPAIEAYATSSTVSVTAAIEQAQAARLTHGTSEDDRNKDVREFLAKRFTKSRAAAIQAAHFQDEGRPIETVWDAVTGITAYARGVQYQDERVKLEREAGALLRSAA